MVFKEVSLSRVQDQLQFRVPDDRIYIPEPDFINEEYVIADISEKEMHAFRELFKELKKRKIPFSCSQSFNGDLHFTVENVPGFCLADEMKNKQLRLA